MKKNYIVNGTYGFALVLMTLLISACNGNKNNKGDAHEDIGVVKIDSSLAHLLKPSNEQVVSTLPIIKAEYGTKIFTEEVQGVINYDSRNQNSVSSRVGGRIERLLIKYNYQPVRKGQLIMEIYAPDLAAAQQELLFLRQSNDQNLFEAAKQRLFLLGMSTPSINQLLKTEKINYRIPVYSNADGYILEKTASAAPTSTTTVTAAGSGDGMSNMGGGSGAPTPAPVAAASINSPVMLREGQYVSAGQSLFTIYNADQLVAEFSLKPAMAAMVEKGNKFVFYKTADKSSAQTATIGMIQPIFKNGENFTIARVYLNQPRFRIGELITAKIPVLLSASWWLPESAVVTLGNQTILFRKEGNVVVPKVIKAGITIGGMVQVNEDISDWQISKNAAYLVDSESFIKMTANGGK
jgi:Cu(I)/Ag(I) efflux system membrane fusion protein